MAKKNCSPIEPFPLDIDRNYFGAWLSGFTDGEGCFRLAIHRRTHSPKHPNRLAGFEIGQRSDDVQVLKLIQSFWKCGVVYTDPRHYTKYESAPKCTLRIINPVELATIVVPHFEKFPLIAKKRRDFLIWRDGVDLAHAVFLRPQRTFRGSRGGRVPKWSAAEALHFSSLCQALKDQRAFNAGNGEVSKKDTYDILFGIH